MKVFFKWCGYLGGVSILMALVLSIFVGTKDGAANLAGSITGWQSSLRIVRWTLITSLTIFWSEACEIFARYKTLSPEQLECAKAMKWRVVTAFIGFEVLVIESVPSKLIGAD